MTAIMSWQESDSKSVSNPHNGQDYLKSERTVLWLDISLAQLCRRGDKSSEMTNEILG